MLMYTFKLSWPTFSVSFHYTIFDLINLYTLKRSAYHLPFNGYPYQRHFQHPPRYSQRSFQPPHSPKQPDILHPPTSTHPSRFSNHHSSRVQSHVSSHHNHGATLKKRRRPSTTQPPDAHIPEALSSIKLARSRPHDWRSGYKPPSKSYFRRHFERLTAPFTITRKF